LDGMPAFLSIPRLEQINVYFAHFFTN